jgi:hypothetical protein
MEGALPSASRRWRESISRRTRRVTAKGPARVERSGWRGEIKPRGCPLVASSRTRFGIVPLNLLIDLVPGEGFAPRHL